jgi:signal transduction histidine kinase
MALAEILIVEDQQTIAENIRNTLQRLGYSVSGIVNAGKDVMTQVATTTPDVILMDIELQGDMNGLVTAEQLRTQCNIPIVYLTSYADGDRLQRARIIGPFEYLATPFEERELQTAIEVALYKQQVGQKLRESEERFRELNVKHKQLEHQLRQINQQLQETSQHKSNFLASMSHELRTPLNAMIGYTSLTLNALKESLPLEHLQNLIRAEQSARTLLQLINDVLDFSKIEAGKMQTFIEEIELRDLLEDVMITAEGLISGKSVALQSDFPDTLPIIESDYTRLKQIFDNLVGNAIKFTSEGHVAVRVIPQEDKHMVRVAIEDTGCGIPSEFRGGLFELFRQVDGSIRKKFGGTGLGLAITKRLSDMLGLTIEVQSETNKGTTFWLNIPLKLAQPAQEIATAPETSSQVPEPSGSVAEILCCCDQHVCSTLKRRLTPLPLEVRHVATVAECIAKARQVPIWALIVQRDDQQAERFTQLQNEPSLRQTKIITIPSTQPEATEANFFTQIETIVRSITLAGTHSILVVDDNDLNLNLMSHILEAAGYKVYKAKSAPEGIDLATKLSPEAILMDVAMPGMDGFEATRFLKQSPETADITVIACSAFPVHEYKDRAVQAGCEGYIMKPIEPHRLVEQVTKFILTSKVKKFAQKFVTR